MVGQFRARWTMSDSVCPTEQRAEEQGDRARRAAAVGAHIENQRVGVRQQLHRLCDRIARFLGRKKFVSSK